MDPDDNDPMAGLRADAADVLADNLVDAPQAPQTEGPRSPPVFDPSSLPAYTPSSPAPGLLPNPPTWDAYAPQPATAPPGNTPNLSSVLPPAHVKENKGGVDIFVGGGGDDLPGFGAMKGYASDYAKQTERPTVYLPNARIGDIVDAIRKGSTSDGPVNLVGHSWAGPDVYNATVEAGRQGWHVTNVVTLDPVSGPFATPEGTLDSTHWMNVRATTDHPDLSDGVTHVPFLSSKPSNLPIDQADENKVVDAHHEEVSRMMRLSGARALLDSSRQLKPDSWTDPALSAAAHAQQGAPNDDLDDENLRAAGR